MRIRAVGPWLAAGVCGLLMSAPVQAGIFSHLFSRDNQAGSDQLQTAPQVCPQCPNCQQCQKPEKKKHFCCFKPPEPPRGRVGTSFAADPQAQFPEADQQAQDDRFNKLEKDLTRLTVIVEGMMQKIDPAFKPSGSADAPQAQVPSQPAPTRSATNDPIPPAPISSARGLAPGRLPAVRNGVVSSASAVEAR